MSGMLQFNQPNMYDQAFQQGYGMMDNMYNNIRTNQLRSYLAQLYANNPDMSYQDRLKQASGLMAVYGNPEKSLELDAKALQNEQLMGYRAGTLGLKEQAMMGKVLKKPMPDGTIHYVTVGGQDLGESSVLDEIEARGNQTRTTKAQGNNDITTIVGPGGKSRRVLVDKDSGNVIKDLGEAPVTTFNPFGNETTTETPTKKTQPDAVNKVMNFYKNLQKK